MKVTPPVGGLLASLLAVVNYLQLEQDIAHGWHVAIGAASIFLATFLKVEKE